MGLATIDPHSQKEHIDFHCLSGKFLLRYSDLKTSNLQRNVWPSGRFVGQRPDGVNFDIFKWLHLSYYWVNLHQT